MCNSSKNREEAIEVNLVLDEISEDSFSFASPSKSNSSRNQATIMSKPSKSFFSNLREQVLQNHFITGLHPSILNFAYLFRCVIALLCMIVLGAVNSIAAEYAGWRNPRVQFLDTITGEVLPHVTTLPDIGHDLITFICKLLTGDKHEFIDWFQLPDMCVSYSTTMVLFIFLFHPLRFQMLRRFGVLFGVLNLIRSAVVMLTSLPDPSPVCLAQFSSIHGDYKTQNFFPLGVERMVRRTFLSPGSLPTCGDMIFSGHTCFIFCVLIIFQLYCRPEKLPFHGPKAKFAINLCRRLVWVYSYCAAIVIVATRFHYTLDVLLGVLVTYALWSYYFYNLERLAVLRRSRNWIALLFVWVESEEVLLIDKNISYYPESAAVLKKKTSDTPIAYSPSERTKNSYRHH